MLEVGREAGWGLSTAFLLLFSQGIKFQSQQLRGKGLESKLPLKTSSVVPESVCVVLCMHPCATIACKLMGEHRNSAVGMHLSGPPSEPENARGRGGCSQKPILFLEI